MCNLYLLLYASVSDERIFFSFSFCSSLTFTFSILSFLPQSFRQSRAVIWWCIHSRSFSFLRRLSYHLLCHTHSSLTFMFDWLCGGCCSAAAYSIVPFNFHALFSTHLIDSIDTESHTSLRWVLCECVFIIGLFLFMWSPLANRPKMIFLLITQFHFISSMCVCAGGVPFLAQWTDIRLYEFIFIFECLNNYNCDRFVLGFFFLVSLSYISSFSFNSRF